MVDFIPNRKFRRKYNKLFKIDPAQANLLLLFSEPADANGKVKPDPQELTELYNARFNHPDEYALKGDY